MNLLVVLSERAFGTLHAAVRELLTDLDSSYRIVFACPSNDGSAESAGFEETSLEVTVPFAIQHRHYRFENLLAYVVVGSSCEAAAVSPHYPIVWLQEPNGSGSGSLDTEFGSLQHRAALVVGEPSLLSVVPLDPRRFVSLDDARASDLTNALHQREPKHHDRWLHSILADELFGRDELVRVAASATTHHGVRSNGAIRRIERRDPHDFNASDRFLFEQSAQPGLSTHRDDASTAAFHVDIAQLQLVNTINIRDVVRPLRAAIEQGKSQQAIRPLARLTLLRLRDSGVEPDSSDVVSAVMLTRSAGLLDAFDIESIMWLAPASDVPDDVFREMSTQLSGVASVAAQAALWRRQAPADRDASELAVALARIDGYARYPSLWLTGLDYWRKLEGYEWNGEGSTDLPLVEDSSTGLATRDDLTSEAMTLLAAEEFADSAAQFELVRRSCRRSETPVPSTELAATLNAGWSYAKAHAPMTLWQPYLSGTLFASGPQRSLVGLRSLLYRLSAEIPVEAEPPKPVDPPNRSWWARFQRVWRT